MRNFIASHLRRLGTAFGVAVGAWAFGAGPALADSLYVSDLSDNTVKRFDADTGAYLGEFVKNKSGRLKGPMGLVFAANGNLLVVNQNFDTDIPGEILRYRGATGAFRGAVVAHDDPDAPFAPRGIIRSKNIVFVADLTGNGPNEPNGRLLAYNTAGKLIADLTPDPSVFPGTRDGEFHPRGVVLGPDGMLYVAVVHDLNPASADFKPTNPLAGWILRFDPKAVNARAEVFASHTRGGCSAHLHRPEGLAFGPDGRLYVIAYRADSNDTDKILIFRRTGQCFGSIKLAEAGDANRAVGFTLLFGPGGKLFVPIYTGPTFAGEVRRYDVSTGQYTSFVPSAATGGPLGAASYLTFGKTNPATLAYEP